MLNPYDLVSIYVDDLRPLPTPLMLVVLEFSGLVTRGQRSMSFWVYTAPARHFRAATCRSVSASVPLTSSSSSRSYHLPLT